MFVRNGISSNKVEVNVFPLDIECLVIKLNIRKAKWLVYDFYFHLYKMMIVMSAILIKYWIVQFIILKNFN